MCINEKKSTLKRSISLILTLICLLSLPLPAGASSLEVSKFSTRPIILLNDQEVKSEVAPVLVNGRLMLPVGVIFKALGAEVTWHEKERRVTATKGDLTILMEIGTSSMAVNGVPRKLEVPPMLIENRTFIPVRAVAEAMGLEVSWDPDTYTASLKDSFYVATNHVLSVGDFNLTIGQSKAQVIQMLGQPQRIDPSELGFDWYIYPNAYRNYLQVGIQNDKVVALYTNAKGFTYDQKLTQGKPIADAEALYFDLMPIYDGVKGTYINGCEVVLFFDLHAETTLTAIMITEYSTSLNDPLKILKSDKREAFIRGQELQMMDIASAVRVRMELSIYIWDETLSKVARAHSQDMADKKYFSHENLEGKSPFDRMKAGGIDYRKAAENIAVGYANAIYAHEAWMNSEGHRKNLLAAISHFGGGVAEGTEFEGQLYFTENFYTPK